MYTSALLKMQEIRTETTENWYSHIHKSVTEHEDLSVTESRVQMDREVLANRPDIIV
jgi:hypothetical protein